jgi:hypothetical protein
MPMIAAELSSEIKTKVEEKNSELAGKWDDVSNMDWLFDAIAEAVIEHITTNQLVVTSVVNAAVGVSPAETYLAGVGTSTTIS